MRKSVGLLALGLGAGLGVGKPSLAGLGTRVEGVLELAEQQAPVSAAEAVAERIVAQARRQAGQLPE